jgi:hypothetical protein
MDDILKKLKDAYDKTAKAKLSDMEDVAKRTQFSDPNHAGSYLNSGLSNLILDIDEDFELDQYGNAANPTLVEQTPLTAFSSKEKFGKSGLGASYDKLLEQKERDKYYNNYLNSISEQADLNKKEEELKQPRFTKIFKKD